MANHKKSERKPKGETETEIHPDAWKRFEAAVDAATRKGSSDRKSRAESSRKKKK